MIIGETRVGKRNAEGIGLIEEGNGYCVAVAWLFPDSYLKLETTIVVGVYHELYVMLLFLRGGV